MLSVSKDLNVHWLRFYQCAAVSIHIDCVSENASDETEARIRSQNEYHRTMSQFVGWCSIGIIALLSSLGKLSYFRKIYTST